MAKLSKKYKYCALRKTINPQLPGCTGTYIIHYIYTKSDVFWSSEKLCRTNRLFCNDIFLVQSGYVFSMFFIDSTRGFDV